MHYSIYCVIHKVIVDQLVHFKGAIINFIDQAQLPG